MTRLVLVVLGLVLSSASVGLAAAEEQPAAAGGMMLRGSEFAADREAASSNQGRECPPGRCPQITCIPEAKMAQKKCGMASNMCPSGFCAAVGNCTSCSRRSLFSEDNDRNN